MKKKILNLYNKYYKNNLLINRFAKVFSVDVLVRASNFLLLPLFLFLMTKEQIGVFNYYYFYVLSLIFILNLGLYVGLTKLYHDYNTKEEKAELTFSVNVTLFLFLSLFYSFFYFTNYDVNLSEFLDFKDYQKYRIPIAFALFVMIFNNLLAAYFMTAEKIKFLQIYNICRMLLVNIVVFSVLLFSDGEKVLNRLIFTYIAEFVVLAIFYIFCIKNMKFKYNFKMSLKALKIGFPLMASAAFASFVNFGDKYFIQKECGVLVNSIYTTAIQYSVIITVIYTSFQSIWLPLFIKEKDLSTLKRKTNRNAKVIFILLSIISFGIILFIIGMLYFGLMPAEYKDIVFVLLLTLPASIINALSGLYSNYFIYFEKTHTITAIGIFTSLISIPIFSFLVSNIGVYGAASTLIIINLMTFMMYYFSSRYYLNNRLKIKR